MSHAKTPLINEIDYEELIQRLIDTMPALCTIEKDFRAAKMNLEIISDTFFGVLER